MAELNVNDISISTINPTDKVFGFSPTASKAPTVNTLLSAAPGVMATGTCATADSTALKEVTSSDWVGSPGQSIIIEFSTANTADDITISINQGTAVAVYALNSSLRLGAGAIPAGAMIFTLNADGTKFYAHTDVVSKNDFQIKHADGSIKYFGNSSQDGFINSIKNANLAIPPKANSKANFILLDNNTNTPDTSKYWQIECITYGINGTPPIQYFEQTARALGQGTVLEYKRSGSLSNSYSSSATVTWGSWQQITPGTSIVPGTTWPVTSDSISTALSRKQEALVSGTNIKTVAGTSLLGSGNIAVATMSGANAGGICNTAKATAAKVVSINGFSLYTGATVKVMFSNGNNGITPTLNVNSTGAISIKVINNGIKKGIGIEANDAYVKSQKYGYWQGASSKSYQIWAPNTILEFIYDGTDWVIIGNPVVASYYTSDYGYIVYADGLIKQWCSVNTNSDKNTHTFKIDFSNTNWWGIYLPESSNSGDDDSDVIDWYINKEEKTKSGFTTYSSGNPTYPTWLAIGY